MQIYAKCQLDFFFGVVLSIKLTFLFRVSFELIFGLKVRIFYLFIFELIGRLMLYSPAMIDFGDFWFFFSRHFCVKIAKYFQILLKGLFVLFTK